MKPEFAQALVQKFLLDHADLLDIHRNDIKDWIVEYFDGIMPDHNKFYEVKNLISFYTFASRDSIYRIDHKKAENYFKKHPEHMKEYLKKKGKA